MLASYAALRPRTPPRREKVGGGQGGTQGGRRGVRGEGCGGPVIEILVVEVVEKVQEEVWQEVQQDESWRSWWRHRGLSRRLWPVAWREAGQSELVDRRAMDWDKNQTGPDDNFSVFLLFVRPARWLTLRPHPSAPTATPTPGRSTSRRRLPSTYSQHCPRLSPSPPVRISGHTHLRPPPS